MCFVSVCQLEWAKPTEMFAFAIVWNWLGLIYLFDFRFTENTFDEFFFVDLIFLPPLTLTLSPSRFISLFRPILWLVCLFIFLMLFATYRFSIDWMAIRKWILSFFSLFADCFCCCFHYWWFCLAPSTGKIIDRLIRGFSWTRPHFGHERCRAHWFFSMKFH